MVFILITIQDQIPSMTGFNLGCIDDLNIFEYENVPVNDGLDHPLDKKNNLDVFQSI